MKRSTSIVSMLGATAILVIGGPAALGAFASAPTEARQISLHHGDYEFEGAPEPAVVGRFTSHSDQDAAMRVTLFRTPTSTGIEEKEVIVETTRSRSGAITLEGAVPASGLRAGARLRAVYETFDEQEAQVWSIERVWTKQ